MIGNLETAIGALLREAAPSVFGGDPPGVEVSVSAGEWEVDPQSLEGAAPEARPDDGVDDFPFDPLAPPASFTLTLPPSPGRRRLWLTTPGGDRTALRDGEVAWDALDPRVFRLALLPHTDVTGVTGVRVLYGTVALYMTFRANRRLAVELAGPDRASVGAAEALAAGIIELNRQALVAGSAATEAAGDYTTRTVVRALRAVGGGAPTATRRRLDYLAEVELRVSRALAEGEGEPIRRIRTAGRPLDPRRPIDIHADVEA